MKFQMTKWNRDSISLRGLIGLLITLNLSACSVPFFSGYGAKGQTREEFTRYVEKVFKLQNGLSSQMMALADSEDKPKNMEAILQTEQRMQKMCEALNQYATLDSEGEDVSLLLQRRVEQTATDCEKAAKELQVQLLTPNNNSKK